MQIPRSGKTTGGQFGVSAFGLTLLRPRLALGLACAFLFDVPALPLLAQKPSGPSSPPVPSSAPVPTAKGSADPFEQNDLLYGDKGSTAAQPNGDAKVCFLPPLDALRSP